MPKRGTYNFVLKYQLNNHTKLSLHSSAQSIGSTRYHEGKKHFYYHVGSYIGVKTASNHAGSLSGHHITMNKGEAKKPVVNQLCYIGKSYCSFQETTRKPGLTAPDHSILSHDRDGNVLAGLSLHLFDHEKEKAGLTIWFREDKEADLDVQNFNEMKSVRELLIH